MHDTSTLRLGGAAPLSSARSEYLRLVGAMTDAVDGTIPKKRGILASPIFVGLMDIGLFSIPSRSSLDLFHRTSMDR